MRQWLGMGVQKLTWVSCIGLFHTADSHRPKRCAKEGDISRGQSLGKGSLTSSSRNAVSSREGNGV